MLQAADNTAGTGRRSSQLIKPIWLLQAAETYSSAEDSEENAEADVESDAEVIEDFLQKMAARNRNYIRTRDRLFTFSGHSLAFSSER